MRRGSSAPQSAASQPTASISDSVVASIEPISVRVAAAVKLTGLSRSKIYELIQSGDIEVVKVGRSTLLPFRSLRRLIIQDSETD